MIPDGASISGLAVRQQCDDSGLEVKTVDLVELAASDIFAEDEALAIARIEMGSAGRLGCERQLSPRSAGHLHLMNLVTVGEARRDQHLAPHRIPAGETGCAEVAVALGILNDR